MDKKKTFPHENLNIYHSFFIIIIIIIIIFSVNFLQICRCTVSNFVIELSPKNMSVNCLVGELSLNYLDVSKAFDVVWQDSLLRKISILLLWWHISATR